jgi:hypothetical protein
MFFAVPKRPFDPVPSMWTSMWRQYLHLHRKLHLLSLHAEYRWINAVTSLRDKLKR